MRSKAATALETPDQLWVQLKIMALEWASYGGLTGKNHMKAEGAEQFGDEQDSFGVVRYDVLPLNNDVTKSTLSTH